MACSDPDSGDDDSGLEIQIIPNDKSYDKRSFFR